MRLVEIWGVVFLLLHYLALHLAEGEPLVVIAVPTFWTACEGAHRLFDSDVAEDAAGVTWLVSCHYSIINFKIIN